MKTLVDHLWDSAKYVHVAGPEANAPVSRGLKEELSAI